MNANLLKRVAELEKIIRKAGKDAAVWIVGDNARVRCDINRQRGGDNDFENPYLARCWIEKALNSHMGGLVDYYVDNIADLEPEAETLREVLRVILPYPIIVERRSGQVIDGKVQPSIFDAEHLPAILAMRGVSPGMRADIRVWCLVALIKQYTDESGLRERWKGDALTEDDARMLLAFSTIYGWDRVDIGRGEVVRDFLQIFCEVTGLPLLEKPENAPGSPTTGTQAEDAQNDLRAL